MNPIPTPDAAPPAQPVVEFVRTQRQTAAYLFLGLSALLLVATIALAYRAFRTDTAPAADKPAAKADTPDAPADAPKTEIADPKRPSYMVGWIGTFAGFLVTALVGGWLMVGLPRPTVEGQRTQARVVLLTAGGLLGLLLILFGAAFFYLWSDSLTKAVETARWEHVKWVAYPLLMVIAGAGLILLGILPARAEERNNLTLRRLVYGSNFGLTVLLLLVVMVVANVVVAQKVPSQLDTTETGFYTLSDNTKAFLARLTEPVTLYVIRPNETDRLTNDIRQFAYSAQEAANGRLTAKFVSPVSNRKELQQLRDKYPRITADDGVFLTAGEDAKRNAFIPARDLLEAGPGRSQAFAGESRVIRELRFLAENETKPVVYFTQNNGELSLTSDRAGGAATGGAATQLKAFLEKAYLDVRPLTFDLKAPAVPDDAAVVVVAEPQTPLSDAAAGALRKYMAEPRKAGGKGKLIVLAGATPGADNKGMARTGLEALLAEYNVRLDDKFLYGFPVDTTPEYAVSGVFGRAAMENPVAQTLAAQVRSIPLIYPRVVEAAGGNPQYQAVPLLYTRPGRPTWFETDRVADFEQIERDLIENAAVRGRKAFSDDPRPLAVLVSEAGAPSPHGGPPAAGTGRALVVGNSFVFADRFAEQLRGAPITFDMLSAAVDWLRDRPPLATTAEAKVYKEYQFPEPAAVDTTRLLYLPLGLGLLIVAGLGAGVYVTRRK